MNHVVSPGRSQLAAAVLATTLVASTAHAADPDAAAHDGDALEQVTVTARRTTEKLIDVPVAASVVSAQTIERYGISDASSIGYLVPQVSFEPTQGGAGGSLSIRGIGSSGTDSAAEQTVVTVLDGIPISRGQIVRLAFFDVADVNILKGPQALFFGKNSPGGVLSVQSAGAGDELQLRGKLGYEFYAQDKILEGSASGPVSDTFGVRLAVRATDMRGWLQNDARALPNPFASVPGLSATIPGASNTYEPGSRQVSGRLTLDWHPTGDFSNVLKLFSGAYQDNGTSSMDEISHCGSGTTVPSSLGVVDPYGNCVVDGHTSIGAVPALEASKWPDAGDGHLFNRFHTTLVSNTLEAKLNGWNISSVSGYFDYSRHALDNLTDTVYPYGGTAANLETFAQLSQELRATSTFSGPLKLIGGLYYEHSHLRTGNAAMVAPFGPDPLTGKYETWDRYSYETGDAYSGFAQARWAILPNLELAGGARYTHENKTGTLYNSFAHPDFAALLAPAGAVIGGSLSENNVSPEATLTWHPTDETMLYGAFKTGYKSGGFGAPSIVTANIQTGADIEYKPEKVKGGEIGAKMQLLDDQLRLTATVYHYRYTDLQISDFIAATISQLTLNAGSSKTEGFEAEAQWRVNHELTVNGGFGYSHARYISFNNIACYGGQTAATGCNEATGLQDLSGKPLFRAPDYTANLGFDYQQPLAAGFMLGLSGNIRYSDGYFTQEADSAFATQNAYVIVDATLRLFPESDRWSVDLIGRNLNNKRYAIASLDASSAPAGTVDSVISRPRQIELDIGVHF